MTKSNRDMAMECKVAKAVYGIETMMLDSLGLGHYAPYAVDLSARRDAWGTTASLGGASWQILLNEKGEEVELYCYPLPAYSLRLDDAWLLLNHLRDKSKAGKDPHSNWFAVLVLLSRIPVGHEAHEVAKLICWSILEVLTGEDYAATVGVDLLPPENK